MTKAGVRRFWASVHRWTGLTTMAFLLIAAVTGCLLCFDGPIDAALNPDLFKAPGAGAPMAPTEVIDRLEQARPDLVVTQFPLHARPGETLKVAVAPRDAAMNPGFDQVFLDPHDGHIVGTRRIGPGLDRRHIVQAVYLFHYTLLAGTWGRWLMGVVALAWLISNGVGFYLTLPAGKPFWRKWRPMWTLELGAPLRRLMLDIHRAGGLWLLIGLTVLAFTSVSMNFFDEAFTPMVSAISPARPSPFDRPPDRLARTGPTAAGFAQALGAAQDAARRQGLGWEPAVLSWVPERGLYGVMFTPSRFEAYRALGPVSFYVDARTGRVAYADDPYHDSAGRGFSRAIYPLHTGKIAGPLGVALIFLLGLATAEMCVTGFYTWWKNRRPPQAPRRAPSRA